MGLATLEFSDCITDSPHFREKLHQHEKEIEKTSKAIKSLIGQGKDLLLAARNLSAAQRKFAQNLKEFRFESIGEQQTDDELVIGDSLRNLGNLIDEIENERDRMLERALGQFIQPLETFRKEQIGSAKEERKKFEKQTRNYCQFVEKHLSLKTSKVSENILLDSDAQLDMERRQFHQASMHYVLCLQEVQERKKFEFVETLLGFMYGWLTFYHQGHEVSEEHKPYMTDLQYKIQKLRDNFVSFRHEGEKLMNKILSVRGQTRDNFDVTRDESEQLMKKILEKPQESPVNKKVTREGYLFLQEKKALTTTWSKYYCEYKKENKNFTMIPYNQTSGGKVNAVEPSILSSCVRRASDSIEKRFCFDITLQDKPGTLTLQALYEDDRRLWLEAMDGKEPIYHEVQPQTVDRLLDDVGFNFLSMCIASIEKRGLSDQGLYRVVGVSSKVSKLTTMGLDRRKADKLDLDKDGEWEVKTITSALKTYCRSLPEPLMTFTFHDQFIEAAKLPDKESRIRAIHSLLYQIPDLNFRMLDLLMHHLRNVANNSKQNLMTVANIGVCFGPTLLRTQEETMAAIMDIKFCNIIVEIMIENYEKIFKSKPDVNANSKIKVGDESAISSNSPDLTKSVNNSVSLGRADNFTVASSREENSGKRGSNGGADNLGRGDNSSVPTPASSAGSTPSLNSVSTPRSPRQTYAEARAKLRPSTIYNPTSSGAGGFSPRYSYTGEGFSTSNSSSSESLNSRSSANMTTSMPSYVLQSSPKMDEVTRRPPIRQKRVITNRITAYNQHVAGKADRGPERASEPAAYQNFAMGGSKQDHDTTVYQNVGPSYLISSANNGEDNPMTGLAVSKPKPNPNRPKPAPPTKPKNSIKMGGPFQALRKRISNDSMSSSTSSLSSMSSTSNTPRRKVRTLYACEAENDTELSFDPNEIIYNVRASKEPGWLEGTYKGRQGLVPENYVEYLD